MPSLIHEGVIAPVQDSPAFAASLLREVLRVEAQRKQIVGCTELAALKRWLERSLAVASVDELLAWRRLGVIPPRQAAPRWADAASGEACHPRGMRWLLVLALAGCAAPAGSPALVASSTRLPPPPLSDPGVRGASYLAAIAAQLQLRWAGFLEDCRLRLPANHPLNVSTLAATFDLTIGPTGAILGRTQVSTSGNGDFDTAVADVLADASPLPAPPAEVLSDDELAHVRWLFARDRRQAGAATARVLTVELPLAAVVDSLLGRGELMRAARRISAAPVGAERAVAAERVMVAALDEAMASADGAARRAAVEAIGEARVGELAARVREQLATSSDGELERAAITAVVALDDRAAVPVLLAGLRAELIQRAPVALARVAALAALGRAEDAAAVVRAVLEAGPNPIALAALGIAPMAGTRGPASSGPPRLRDELAAWAVAGDPTTRGAVCAALPSAAPDRAAALIARGLGDPDATVRALCIDAAARADTRTGMSDARMPYGFLARLRELVRDRDRWVRARAVAAIAAVASTAVVRSSESWGPVRAAADPAPEVRAAYAPLASASELQMLLADREPEVRAAALGELIQRSPLDTAGPLGRSGTTKRLVLSPAPASAEAAEAGPLAAAAAAPAAAVRRIAASALMDRALLSRLARDESPDVASVALVRLTRLVGRVAMTAPLLDQLAAAPAGSRERVRIALAWLLAQ